MKKKKKVYTPKQHYNAHKRRAKRRGRVFLLTFEEWWGIWQASGHWEVRGIKKGQYVMARPGDKGPYAIGNVKIITCQENVSEAHTGTTRTHGPEARRNMSLAHLGKPLTQKQRDALQPRWEAMKGKKRDPAIGRKISAAKKGNTVISLEQRAQISATLIKYNRNLRKKRQVT